MVFTVPGGVKVVVSPSAKGGGGGGGAGYSFDTTAGQTYSIAATP